MAKLFIEESTLTSIGDAIRGKTGETALLKPLDMPTAIEGIQAGGGIPEEALTLTGGYGYKFANNSWNWFIEEFGDEITTENLFDQSNGRMFSDSTELETIPFDLNMHPERYQVFSYMFTCCKNLKEIGTIRNAWPEKMENMFRECYNLRYLPEFENFNPQRLETYKYASLGTMFYQCYSLRSIPEDFLKKLCTPLVTTTSYPVFYNFGWNYALDEVRGLNPQTGTITSNIFSGGFQLCYRLKDIIFATQDDGTPYSVEWKYQVIDLTTSLGFGGSSTTILGYNSGITADKFVSDDATYQALKNDPDWYALKAEYSRYNHDSAVNTINSLPDTSAYLATAGGTNTIKFKGEAGSATDGGAINTLTEEEIAVATAKGWTVSFA